MKFITKYHAIIPWAIVALLIYFLFAKPCGKEKQLAQYKAMKQQYDSLQRVVDAGVQTKAADHFRDSIQLIEARKQTTAAIEDKKASDKKLTAAQIKFNQFLEGYKNAKPAHVDLVPEDSLKNCDSLAVAAVNLSNEVNRYRKESDEAMNLLNYEVVLRDSVIEAEKSYSQNLLGNFRALQRVADEALKAAKPRGRFLAGAGVIGNQQTFLSGAKIVGAYQTKGGKQYQAGAMIFNNTVYYEGTVLITLFK